MMIFRQDLLLLSTLFLLGLCLFPKETIASQKIANISFQKVELQNIPSQSIRDIYQDSRGFLWIGTYEGLVRYDGHSSKVYVHDQLNLGSIAHNQIATIIEGPNNKLWVGTADGSISIFDYASETFKHIPNHSKTSEDRFIRVLFKDNKDSIWVGTDNGIFTVHPDTYVVTHYTADNTRIFGVWDIEQDDAGNIWAASYMGLLKLNLENNKFELYQAPNLSTPLHAKQLNNIQFDGQNLWIGTFKQGIFLLDTATGTVDHYPHDKSNTTSISGNLIRDILKDTSGNLWVVGHGGASIWSTEQQHFIRLNVFQNRPNSEKNVEPMELFQDKTGIIWMGSANGLYKWLPSTSAFNANSQAINQQLTNNNVYAFASSANNLWVGTLGGVVKVPKNGEFARDYQHPTNSNRVTSLYNRSPTEVWVGSLDGGLKHLNTETGVYSDLQSNHTLPEALQNSTITAIEPAHNNLLWIGSYGFGLYLFDPQEHEVLQSFQSHIHTDRLSSNRVNTLMLASDNRLWVSHHGGGINIINPSNNTSIFLSHNKSNPNSLSSDDVELTYEDSRGNIWVGTLNGLNKLSVEDLKNEQFTFHHFNVENGLPSNVIYGILEDDAGMLWLSTNNGLSKYDPIKHTFSNYNISHGLVSNVFNTRAFHKDANKRLYFGGVQGVVAFDPSDIHHQSAKPSIALTNILTRNKAISYAEATRGTDEIQLTYADYLVAFEFAALDFTAPEHNQYRYKLDGFDKDWINPGKINRATYTNLPSGQYQFLVKASNSDGVWNENGLSIPIRVSPPMWFTWWAYCLYIIATLGLVYRIYTYRAQKLIRNTQKLEQAVIKRTIELQNSHQKIAELLEQKKTLFANVSHEFRTPLSLIIGPLDSLLAKLEDLGLHKQVSLINRNAKRLANLVDQVLELAKLDNAKHLPRKTYPIQASLKVISESFLTVAILRSQSLTVNIDCQGSVTLLDDSLEQILSNLISNAIKYTPPQGSIEVSAQQQKTMLVIKVKDNGSGISPAKQLKVFERFIRLEGSEGIQGSGIGLALVKELVEANAGKVELESTEGQGSTFIVSLPMHQENENTLAPPVLSHPQYTSPLYYQELTQGNNNQQSSTSTSQKTTLLIVEDNPDMQTFIADSLKPNYHCLTANNGKQGLELATEYLPDIIISDLMMPEMTGLDLIKNIRQQDITAHIPFVLLTAKGDDASRIEGWQLDVDDYVAKPFNLTELEARLKRLLSIRRILSKRQARAITTINEQAQRFGNPQDQKFFDKFQQVIQQKYPLSTLNRATVAKELMISERQLSRKISALIDASFSEYLREYRLGQAKMKLAKGEQITRVSFEVGFTSQSYFSSCFKAEFGITPKQFVEQQLT